MTDLLGPASALNAVTTRLSESRTFGTIDTWFKPCSTPAAQDGTQVQAVWLNGIMAQLRGLIRGNGQLIAGTGPVIPEVNTTDTMLLSAVQALIQRGQPNVATDNGTADAMVAAPGRPWDEYKAGMRLYCIKGASANATTTPKINVSGLGQVTVTRRDGTALAASDLGANAAMLLEFDGTVFRHVGLVASDVQTMVGPVTRGRLTGATTYYVDPVAGSNSNNGLSAATAFRTRQKAQDTIVNTLDLNGNNVTVQLLPGTYTDAFIASCGVIGNSNGVGAITWQGTVGNAAAVLIGTTGGNAWLAQGGAQFAIAWMTIQTAGTNTIGLAIGSGGIVSWSNIVWAQCQTAHVSATAGGQGQQTGPCTITGGAGSHIVAADRGGINISGQALTLNGTPPFTQFALVQGTAQITANSLTLTGGATGKQYALITSAASIYLNGQTLPGNAAGTISTTQVM